MLPLRSDIPPINFSNKILLKHVHDTCFLGTCVSKNAKIVFPIQMSFKKHVATRSCLFCYRCVGIVVTVRQILTVKLSVLMHSC